MGSGIKPWIPTNILMLDMGTLNCKRFPPKSTTICSILQFVAVKFRLKFFCSSFVKDICSVPNLKNLTVVKRRIDPGVFFCIVICKAAYNLVNKEVYSEKFGFKSYRPVNFSLVMELIEVHVHMYLLGKMLLYDRSFA